MINDLTTILNYLKRNMEREPSKECLAEHEKEYELRLQDDRKYFELSLYCPLCERHYYHIYIGKNRW